MRLFHPHIAWRSCDDCEKYQYSATDAEPTKDRRTGLPMLRIPGTLPPCIFCRKVPGADGEGTRTPAVGRTHETTPRNRQAIAHYLECRAVGQFPDDSIVKRNAGILYQVEQAHARARDREMIEAVVAMLSAVAGGGGISRR